MPSLPNIPYYERDARKLPDCTDEKYSRALELVEQMKDRGVISLVSNFVYNAESIQEIIDFFEEVLRNSINTRERLILIVVRKVNPALMN